MLSHWTLSQLLVRGSLKVFQLLVMGIVESVSGYGAFSGLHEGGRVWDKIVVSSRAYSYDKRTKQKGKKYCLTTD